MEMMMMMVDDDDDGDDDDADDDDRDDDDDDDDGDDINVLGNLLSMGSMSFLVGPGRQFRSNTDRAEAPSFHPATLPPSVPFLSFSSCMPTPIFPFLPHSSEQKSLFFKHSGSTHDRLRRYDDLHSCCCLLSRASPAPPPLPLRVIQGLSHLERVLLILCCLVLQVLALIWYVLSYIPYGASGEKVLLFWLLVMDEIRSMEAFQHVLWKIYELCMRRGDSHDKEGGVRVTAGAGAGAGAGALGVGGARGGGCFYFFGVFHFIQQEIGEVQCSSPLTRIHNVKSTSCCKVGTSLTWRTQGHSDLESRQ
eukprot:747846-Hanusia_phi.AAC.1